MSRIVRSIAAVGIALSVGGLPAAEWHAAPDGKPDAAGTRQSPWDLESALRQVKIAPGDTLWLAAGTYKHPDRRPGTNGYSLKLIGAEGKPIHVRAMPGERVTVDGGLRVVNPTKFLWIWDIEIIVSENLTQTRVAKERGSHPKDLGRPWGSLNIVGGENCRYIHLVVHDNAHDVEIEHFPKSPIVRTLTDTRTWTVRYRSRGSIRSSRWLFYLRNS